jgi:hypothetical protein
MGFIFSLTAGLVVWIVLWSIGVKSFDAFMLTMVIVLLAAGTRIVLPFLPGNQRS